MAPYKEKEAIIEGGIVISIKEKRYWEVKTLKNGGIDGQWEE